MTFDDLATRFIDDSLATAAGLVNMDLRQDYRQIVLLGCGMDSRPYRCACMPGCQAIVTALQKDVEELELLHAIIDNMHQGRYYKGLNVSMSACISMFIHMICISAFICAPAHNSGPLNTSSMLSPLPGKECTLAV